MPSQGFDLVDALASALRARPGLTGVQIATTDQETWDEPDSIALGKFSIEQDFRGMRGPGSMTTEEDGRLRFGVHVRRDGAGEEIGVEARHRVKAILAEIETCLASDPGVSGSVGWARLVSGDLDHGIGPDHVWFEFTGEFYFKAHF